jgi:mRNA interferase HigB
VPAVEDSLTVDSSATQNIAFTILSLCYEDDMHLIAISRLREAAAKYSDVAIQIEDWNEIVKIATWQNLTEVQQTYGSAEAVGNFTVFNIKGNRYRLIVSINYSKQIIYFKYFLTHAEYDKDNWKNDPYF